MYGVVVGGIRTARILFGPLPLEICLIQGRVTDFLIWVCLLTMFTVTFFKFLYICVWKHMRAMNDDLIVTFVIRSTIFISIWVPTTGFVNRKGNSSEGFCTGIFNNRNEILDPQISPEKLPQPYSPLFWSLCITNLFVIK